MADAQTSRLGILRRQRSVVINGRFLANPHGGVARVGVELLRALSMEIAENSPEIELRIAAPAGVTGHRLGLPEEVRFSRGFRGRLGEQLGLPLLYPGATLIGFCNATPMLARRAVVWIHDAHVFDAPETYPRAYRLWHQTILAAARARKFEVVTVSNFARARLLHYGVNPARIRVIHNGGDHILRAPEDPSALVAAGLLDQPFVLLVGSPARHKNVPFALNALLKGTDKGMRIAVVGLSQAGPYRDAEPLARDPRVLILPRIDDGQLRALYRAARVVLSPSLCEGFGLYAAEAMFADASALVLSDRGALPEVGGAAALYFDPTDPVALADAVNQALEPATATRLRAAAQVQREKFRWRRAARQVVDAFLR